MKGEDTDSFIKAVEKATNGSTITVDMSKTQTITKDVLEEARGKDITLVLDMGDYTWTINGKDITGKDLGDINLKVAFDEQEIPQSTIDGLVKKQSYRTVTLEYDGPFGFSADLSFEVGAEHKGKYVNLYYYNEDSGDLEFQNSGVVDENGYTKHTFTHASSYVAVISDGLAGDYIDENSGTSHIGWIIALIAFAIIVLLGTGFFVKRKSDLKR